MIRKDLIRLDMIDHKRIGLGRIGSDERYRTEYDSVGSDR